MTLGELVSRLQSLPEYQAGRTHIPVTVVRLRSTHDVTGVRTIQYEWAGKPYEEVVLEVGGTHEPV